MISNILKLYDKTMKNKKPMGHIAHLFKSINTFVQYYDYVITLIRRGKFNYLLFENLMVLICKTLSLLQMLSAKFG